MIQQGTDFGFCGPAYTAPMQLQADQNCINYYPEVAEVDGAKMPVALLATPGLASLASVGDGEVRGSWPLPGGAQALVVIGPTVYVASWVSGAISLNAVGSLKTSTGPVCIRDNGALFGGAGGYAVIVDGTYGYYYLLAGSPMKVTFTGGFTSGSPLISVASIPQGLVIAPGVTLTDTGGAIGVPSTIYSGNVTVGEGTESGTPFQASIAAGKNTDSSGVSFVGYAAESFFGSSFFFGSLAVQQQGSLPSNAQAVYVADNQTQVQANLTLTGFTSDPGQDLFFSASTGTFGTTFRASDATYQYSNGNAQWVWNGVQFGFVNGQPATLTIQTLIIQKMGFQLSNFGGLSPGSVGGHNLTSLYQDVLAGKFVLAIDSPVVLGQSFFSQLSVNGNAFAALNATYTVAGDVNTWVWQGTAGQLQNGGIYPVTMTATAAASATLTGFDQNALTLTMSLNAAATVANDSVTATIPVFGQITDPGFLGSDRVAFIEGYLIFAQPGTRTFYTTGPVPYTLLFPGTWFALKDSSSDNIVTIFENSTELWLIGERTTEVWYNAGNSPGVSFARIPAVGPQIGCGAVNSITRVGPALIWFAANEQGQNMVVMQQQYTFQRVSNHGVEHAWSQYTTVSDAIGWSYEEEGHWFYVLTFPTANATWVYDMTASANLGKPCWHQRASGVTVNQDGSLVLNRNRANCYMNFNNTRIVGDYANGSLYEMSRAFYDEAGTALVAQRRAVHVWSKANRKRIFHGWLQVEFTPGAGNQTSPNPQAQLRWSNDGGFTWSNPQTRPIGASGAYSTRTIWTRLGRSRDRVYEVTVADPVQRDIIGVTLFFEPESEQEAA